MNAQHISKSSKSGCDTNSSENKVKISLDVNIHRNKSLCSCDYTWIPGTWDRCVAAAASTTTANTECQGTQQRRLYCVRASFGERQVTRENELRVYRNTVAPSKCKDLSQPVTERECTRSSCYGIWVYSEWSPVSSISKRQLFKIIFYRLNCCSVLRAVGEVFRRARLFASTYLPQT